jgi:prepilin-type processing-associated H-X9-DG protein
MSVVQSPATKIMVAETRNDAQRAIGYQNWSDAANTDFRNRHFAGHLSTSNYLFVDGHVKSLKPTMTMRGTNMWGKFNDQDTTGPCANSSADNERINCDEISAGALGKLNEVEQQFP